MGQWKSYYSNVQKQSLEVFYKKRCSQKFRKFHGKTSVLESLFNKAAGLGLQLYQLETPTQMLSCKICEIYKNTFFEEHLRTAASQCYCVCMYFLKRFPANGRFLFRTTTSLIFQVVEKWSIGCRWADSLSANPTKWSKTLKKFVGKLPTNCLSVFEDFVGLALKG